MVWTCSKHLGWCNFTTQQSTLLRFCLSEDILMLDWGRGCILFHEQRGEGKIRKEKHRTLVSVWIGMNQPLKNNHRCWWKSIWWDSGRNVHRRGNAFKVFIHVEFKSRPRILYPRSSNRQLHDLAPNWNPPKILTTHIIFSISASRFGISLWQYKFALTTDSNYQDERVSHQSF